MAEMDAFERRVADTLLRYADEVVPSVDAAAVAHRVALEHPRRRAGAGLASLRLVAVPRVAWLLLLAAALLAALAGTALVASRLLETAPRVPPRGAALVPTGIDVLTPETWRYLHVVADGDDVLWAVEDAGRLVRYDPATGSGRSWSVSDDAALSTWSITPARDGGVWLLDGRTLRWFDGEVFREVIEAPVEIATAVEAPDGSLWAATGEGAVLHWDGSSWSQLDGGRPSPDSYVGAIAVDAAGQPWISGITQVVVPADEVSRVGGDMAESGWVSRYDGSTWTTFDADDAAPLECPVSIAQLADGAVWFAASCRGAPVLGYEPLGGLARFDGSSWTDTTAQLSGARNTTSVAAGPDGTIWAAAGDLNDGAVTVRRFDGRSWVSYGPSDGLPGGGESGMRVAWALPTKDGVYVGTGAGIYRLNGDRWERAWPTSFVPMDLRNLLAVSRDELWATGAQGGLWHYRGDTWTRDPVDPSRPEGVVHALALAPDGTVWAAGSDGVAYRRDGQWVIADAAEATVITIGRDETVWVGSSSDEDCRVATLRFDGAAWVRRAIGCPPESSGLSSLAVDANGALWAVWTGRVACDGDGSWGGCPVTGLARLEGQSWEVIRELGGIELTTITIVGATPTGDVWVVDDPTAVLVGPEEPDPIRAARFDGTGWTVVAPPDDHSMTGFVVAPDGSLWTTSDRGPARCDGTAWTFPYERAGFPSMRLAAIAPDGTVFGSIGSVLRLPDRAPPP
jgi:hypothetical protein